MRLNDHPKVNIGVKIQTHSTPELILFSTILCSLDNAVLPSFLYHGTYNPLISIHLSFPLDWKFPPNNTLIILFPPKLMFTEYCVNNYAGFPLYQWFSNYVPLNLTSKSEVAYGSF